MADSRAVDLKIRMAGARTASRDADRVSRSVRKIGDSAEHTRKRFRTAQDAGRRFWSAIGTAATVGTTAAIYGAFKATEAAADFNEEVNKSKVIFGGSSQAIIDWAKNASSSMGISAQEALAAAGQFGNVFTTLGVGQEDAAGMSKKIVGLAADMASFNNASPEDTLAAIQSGLRGEFDPLEKYVAGINAAAVQQEALRATHKKSAKDLTAQDKALAFQALLYQRTAKQQGDFARTGDSLANQQKTLKAQWADMQVALGTALIPLLSDVVGWLSTFITGIRDGTGAGGKFAKKAKQVGEFINKYLIQPLTAAYKWITASRDRMTALTIGLGAIAAALIALGIYLSLTTVVVGAVVIGIGLLAAGLYYAYQRVGWFRDGVNAAWGVLKSVATWIYGAGADSFNFLKGVIGGVAGAITDAFNFIKGVPDTVKGVFISVLNWVIDRINDVIGFINGVIGAFNKLPGPDIGEIGLVGHIGASTTEANTAAYQGYTGTGGPGMAGGGLVNRSGVYEVGERGSERVFLPQGAYVEPHGGSQITTSSSPVLLDGKVVATIVHRHAVKKKSTR